MSKILLLFFKGYSQAISEMLNHYTDGYLILCLLLLLNWHHMSSLKLHPRNHIGSLIFMLLGAGTALVLSQSSKLLLWYVNWHFYFIIINYKQFWLLCNSSVLRDTVKKKKQQSLKLASQVSFMNSNSALLNLIRCRHKILFFIIVYGKYADPINQLLTFEVLVLWHWARPVFVQIKSIVLTYCISFFYF